MATITVTEDTIDGREGRGFINTWEAFATLGDVGEAIEHVSCRDRCVQFTGTWGSGGTMLLQGSNDNTNWFTLKDSGGTSISLTADGMRQVLEMPRYIRPKLSAGTGSIDIDVILLERMGFR